jgi:hypothetical protein
MRSYEEGCGGCWRMYAEGRIELREVDKPVGKRYLDERSGPHQSREGHPSAVSN